MKVLHLIAGPFSEGAARGTMLLHSGLLKIGIESRVIGTHEYKLPSVSQVISAKERSLASYYLHMYSEKIPLLFYRNQRDCGFHSAYFGYNIKKHPWYKWADIIHLHWINHGMISLRQINSFDKPVVWTMRDMWPFTGGCHYAGECIKYQTGCSYCPALGSKSRHDLAWLNVSRKKKFFTDNIHPVAISQWLYDCAKKSEVLGNLEMRMIPNCTDTEIFKPIPKDLAKRVLGWDEEKKVVLSGALTLNSAVKGMDHFFRAITEINDDYNIAIFGDTNTLDNERQRMIAYDLGLLHDPLTLNLVYSAADVFVAPSLQEAFGKTIIESMACGTPVVAYNATGPKDIVVHKKCGYLAEPFKPESLAKGIEYVLSESNKGNALERFARERVLNEYGLVPVAKKYFNLYNSMIYV